MQLIISRHIIRPSEEQNSVQWTEFSHFGFCKTTLISSYTVFAINAPTSEKPTTLVFFFFFFEKYGHMNGMKIKPHKCPGQGLAAFQKCFSKILASSFHCWGGRERGNFGTLRTSGDYRWLRHLITHLWRPSDIESPGGQGDPGEELLESRCVERKRKERMKNNIFHLWY